ncbi:MAG: hypothetical protein H2069_01920 [Legionella sp.]|nr:hypothetical protein [Legionella sp.]
MNPILVKKLKDRGFNLREDIENITDPILIDALNSLLVIDTTLQQAKLPEEIERIGIYITQLTIRDVDNQKKLFLSHLSCFDEQNDLALDKLAKALGIDQVSKFNTIIQSFLLFADLSSVCNFHKGTEELYMSFKVIPSEIRHTLALEKLKRLSEKPSEEQVIHEKKYEEELWGQCIRFELHQLDLFTKVVSTKEDYDLLNQLFGKEALIEGLKVKQNTFESMLSARGYDAISSSNSFENKCHFSNPNTFFQGDQSASNTTHIMQIEASNDFNIVTESNETIDDLKHIHYVEYVDYSSDKSEGNYYSPPRN